MLHSKPVCSQYKSIRGSGSKLKSGGLCRYGCAGRNPRKLYYSRLVQSDLAYPVLFYPDPSPSGRKSLVTDLQHMPCIHTVCVFDYPVPSPIRIFLWKTLVCGYARSDCTPKNAVSEGQPSKVLIFQCPRLRSYFAFLRVQHDP